MNLTPPAQRGGTLGLRQPLDTVRGTESAVCHGFDAALSQPPSGRVLCGRSAGLSRSSAVVLRREAPPQPAGGNRVNILFCSKKARFSEAFGMPRRTAGFVVDLGTNDDSSDERGLCSLG